VLPVLVPEGKQFLYGLEGSPFTLSELESARPSPEAVHCGIRCRVCDKYLWLLWYAICHFVFLSSTKILNTFHISGLGTVLSPESVISEALRKKTYVWGTYPDPNVADKAAPTSDSVQPERPRLPERL
jgi:hypothetical protein